MDAVELLEHDHRMVEQLFRDYGAAASDAQKRGVVDIMIRELAKHAALEELMVYPLAKQVLADGARETEEHLAEHMVVKKLLHQLDGMKAGDPQTDGVMSELQSAVTKHIDEEEHEMFRELRAAVDEQALDELGNEIDKAKHVAPTRPHPAAPEEPPALTMAAPIAAIYDRLRDRLQHRPKT
ncbi:MAG: hemerythrin domain-containing protein [Acidothermaceae bacterium]